MLAGALDDSNDARAAYAAFQNDMESRCAQGKSRFTQTNLEPPTPPPDSPPLFVSANPTTPLPTAATAFSHPANGT